MSVARRPLLTATAAGTLLCALWFVPSANATVEQPSAQQRTGTAVQQAGATVRQAGTTVRQAGATGDAQRLVLADTGGVDTTPYLIGGTAFLGLGAGLVAFAVRRGAPTAL